MLIATESPIRSECAIFPSTLPSGLVIPSIAPNEPLTFHSSPYQEHTRLYMSQLYPPACQDVCRKNKQQTSYTVYILSSSLPDRFFPRVVLLQEYVSNKSIENSYDFDL